MPAGELAPDRRRRVLETAAREFAAAGYERASLNAIIRACGLSKSSFYYYFESKAALFDTVVREAMRELGGELDIPDPNALAGPHFWPTVSRLVADVLALAGRQSWHAEVGKLFYLSDMPAQHSPALREALRSIGSWVDQALASGRECGAIRDDLPPSLLAVLVTGVLQGLDRWSLQHFHEYPAPAQAELARTQIDILHRVLAPSPRATRTVPPGETM